MNKYFLVFISVLLALSLTLFFFYSRDILSQRNGDLLEGCVPINLQVQNVSSTSFSVEWETSEECLGLVRYGESIDSLGYFAINEENNFAAKRHWVEVKNLKPSSIYYFVIASEGVEYGVEGAPVVINTKAF